MSENINLIGIDESVKKDSKLSANSIKFKQNSLSIEKRKYIANLRESIDRYKQELSELDREDSDYENKVEGKTFVIAKMEAEIRIESGEEVPRNFVNSRAIKLKEEWLRNCVNNTIGCTTFGSNTEISTENTDSNNENFINVEEVSQNREEEISDSVDEAIETESNEIKEEDVKEFYDNAFNNIGVEQNSEEEKIDRGELEEEINQKLQEVYGNIDEAKESLRVSENSYQEDYNTENTGYIDQDYIPMTDDAVAASQEKLENDKYQEINKSDNISDEVIEEREEIVVAPEREEIPEFTVAKNDDIEKNVEPKSIVISEDEKAKLKTYSFEELKELISARSKETKELEQKANSMEADIEEGRKMNAAAAEEEEIAVKMREELEAEKSKKEEELKDKMIERVVAIESRNNSLNSDIQNREEEIANINKDTESRREKISSINKGNDTIKEEISKLEEMQLMFSDDQPKGDLENSKIR